MLWAKALKQEQLPKTCMTRGVEMGPNQLVKKLCGIILQAVESVVGRSNSLVKWNLLEGSMNWASQPAGSIAGGVLSVITGNIT